MKKLYGKYVIFALSVLLILSNFSYATQLMFCGMSGNTETCECTHDPGKHYEGISITTEKTRCCQEETNELANSNTLATLKTELPLDINTFAALVLVLNQSNEALPGSYLNVNIDKSHLPKLDIPILISSLLI